MENSATDTVGNFPVITHRELYICIRTRKATIDNLCAYVQEKCSLRDCSEGTVKLIKKRLTAFKSNFQIKWKSCARLKQRFEERYRSWLDNEIGFPKKVYNITQTENEPRPSTSSVGRPRKSFEDSSEKSKRRHLQNLITAYSVDELCEAIKISLRRTGKRDAATLLEEMVHASPGRATKYKKAYKSAVVKPTSYMPNEALAMIIQNQLTKRQYTNIRLGAKNRHCNIYPLYNLIRESKRACYPPSETIKITDISAEIELQAIVSHTIIRIYEVQEEVFQKVFSTSKDFTILFKWGCDGSSGQRQYKQKFYGLDENDLKYCDSHIFVICLVPLQIYATDISSAAKQILWHNPRPSSPRFCRPIKLIFEKESTQLIKTEVKKCEEQIKSIQPTNIQINGTEIQILQKFQLTMVDGKVCNAISGTSSQVCYICKAKPKQMSFKPISINREKFTFGLSVLHAWIRFFECLLHISYRLNFKKWQARSEGEKQSMANRKTEIQKKVKTEMGLIVDQPRAEGSGTSNDGNTARRFFLNPSTSAAITGINEELITRSSVILRTISTGYPIHLENFNKYLSQTTELYFKLYSWFYLPVTLHKIFIHGGDIIQAAILPIGMLSEEAQEARNKHIKIFRERHSRKFSRKSNMQDVLNMLLVSSDPVISHITPFAEKPVKSLSEDIKSLIAAPIVSETTMHTSECQDEKEEDSD